MDARDVETCFGEEAIRVDDPSGLWLELTGSERDSRTPWTGSGVGADEAIRGLHSVTMAVRSLGPTLELMTSLLGCRVTDEVEHRTRVALGGDGPGHSIDIVVDPDAEAAINGLGTVHHVAVAVSSDDDQRRLRDELLRAGLRVTDVRDRCYFKSIYFREPGGVLFEVATIQPGFTVDEEGSSLGRALKLPSCCIRLMLSIWPQCSTHLPSAMRMMSITPKDTLLPPGGMPINSPFCVPLQV